MLTPCTGPAYPILQKWDDWAIQNRRWDMRRAIWAIYDLIEGRYFPPESARSVDTFLSERLKSADLETVKNEISKAREKKRFLATTPVKIMFSELEIF